MQNASSTKELVLARAKVDGLKMILEGYFGAMLCFCFICIQSNLRWKLR